MYIVVHRPIEINGRSFMPRQGEASIIPKELEQFLEAHHVRNCVRVADDALAPTNTGIAYIPPALKED